MQEKPVPKSRKRISLGSAALLLASASLIGQVLGLLRTKLVAANFPATGPHSTDPYFAAFNIPDFFFYTLAAGALGVAFIPVLAERLHRGDRKGMWMLTSSLMNMLGIVMALVAVIIFVFAEPLIHHIVGPGLPPRQLHVAVVIMRLLSLNPLLFTISGILTSVQQTLGRFFFFALAPLFYNVSIIVSIFVFRHTSLGLEGLGIGALVGAVLQLGVVAFGLIGTNFRWWPHIIWRSSDFRQILRQLPPRSIDQGMDQIESIVETHFATRLALGSVSFYNYAYTLQTAPTLLIGTAISTAAFPRLAQRLAQGRPDLFRRDFLQILRLMVWMTLPVVVVCYFARGYFARLIFVKDSVEIAVLFGYLTLAIFFRTIYSIISRWFYAQKDTKTPLFVSVFTISLNIFLVYMWARPSAYGVVGLAMAQSIVALVEVFILMAIMLFRDRGLFDAKFWGGIWRIISVSGFSLLTGFIMISLLPLGSADRGPFALGGKLLLIAGAVAVTHISISGLFGLEEARPIFVWLKRIVFRPIKTQY